MVVKYADAVVQTDSGNIVRKMLAHDGQLMMVEVVFKEPSDDYGMHNHPHEQIAYITKGSVEFVVEGQAPVILSAGDSVYVEPHVMHGAKNLEAGTTLLDIFTPMRDDFITK